MTERQILMALLSIPAVLILAWGYRELREDLELELERRTEAEMHRAKGAVIHWFETTWPCQGFDYNERGEKECTIRQRLNDPKPERKRR